MRTDLAHWLLLWIQFNIQDPGVPDGNSEPHPGQLYYQQASTKPAAMAQPQQPQQPQQLPLLTNLWNMGMQQLGLVAVDATNPASPGGRDVEASASRDPSTQGTGVASTASASAAATQPPPPRPQPPQTSAGGMMAVPPGSHRFRALINVHDKEGAVHLAKELAATGAVELISTGGTHRLLEAAALPVTQLVEETGFPEILDGKWGTRCMSNELHAQVVTRSQRLHESEELKAAEMVPIDLVVMNLFLFGSTVQPHTLAEDAVENIDIGTPTMLRAAARNYPNVVVLVDPADYAWVAARLRNTMASTDTATTGERGCGLTLDERRRLAYKAFRHVAVYDLSIAEYLGGGGVGVAAEPLTATQELAVGWRKLCTVRAVGAAAERDATVYAPLLELDPGVDGSVDGGVGGGGGICAARKLGGPELTLPRLTDADVAWRAVVTFATAGDSVCVAVVHDGIVTGLCAAEDEEGVSLLEVYQRAIAVYPPLGATLATNVVLDGATAAAIVAAGSAQWTAILAPEIDDDALDMFRSSEEQDAARAAAQGRRRTTEEITLLEVPLMINPDDEEDEDGDDEAENETDDGVVADAASGKAPRTSRSGVLLDALDLVPLTGGGLLVREPLPPREQASWTVVSDERPTAEELRDLVFGWRLLPHLPHGAIVLCVERQMISPAYTWADQAQGVELALRVAGGAASGAILACDGPLTSTSAVELAAAGGIVAIVQPGGAARDSSLIELANEYGLTMIFTHHRPFRRRRP